jgi:hypothetical protein
MQASEMIRTPRNPPSAQDVRQLLKTEEPVYDTIQHNISRAARGNRSLRHVFIR